MRNSRERIAARGLALLGIEPFVQFLRAVRDEDNCLATQLANTALDEGESVEEMFFTGERLGFELRVEQVGKRRLRVEFGCVAGPDAGDGGAWSVEVDDAGRLVGATVESIWIS
jgi:hypothetical protein